MGSKFRTKGKTDLLSPAVKQLLRTHGYDSIEALAAAAGVSPEAAFAVLTPDDETRKFWKIVALLADSLHVTLDELATMWEEIRPALMAALEDLESGGEGTLDQVAEILRCKRFAG